MHEITNKMKKILNDLADLVYNPPTAENVIMPISGEEARAGMLEMTQLIYRAAKMLKLLLQKLTDSEAPRRWPGDVIYEA